MKNLKHRLTRVARDDVDVLCLVDGRIDEIGRNDASGRWRLDIRIPAHNDRDMLADALLRHVRKIRPRKGAGEMLAEPVVGHVADRKDTLSLADVVIGDFTGENRR